MNTNIQTMTMLKIRIEIYYKKNDDVFKQINEQKQVLFMKTNKSIKRTNYNKLS